MGRVTSAQQWYGGPGALPLTVDGCPGCTFVVRPATGSGRVRCGPVGVVVQPAGAGAPGWLIGRHVRRCAMVRDDDPQHGTHGTSRVGRLVGATRPRLPARGRGPGDGLPDDRHACRLRPWSRRPRPGADRWPSASAIWSFSLIAGGALLAAGTNRLAAIVASLKRSVGGGGPAARALGGSVRGARGGRQRDPERGAAGPRARHRLVRRGGHPRAAVRSIACGPGRPAGRPGRRTAGSRWTIRWTPRCATRNGSAAGWPAPTSSSWSASMPPSSSATGCSSARRPARSSAPSQIPAWIASLPRQRTLTAGRRARLLAMTRPTGAHSAGDARRSW